MYGEAEGVIAGLAAVGRVLLVHLHRHAHRQRHLLVVVSGVTVQSAGTVLADLWSCTFTGP